MSQAQKGAWGFNGLLELVQLVPYEICSEFGTTLDAVQVWWELEHKQQRNASDVGIELALREKSQV